jgi:hypothetical protein
MFAMLRQFQKIYLLVDRCENKINKAAQPMFAMLRQ